MIALFTRVSGEPGPGHLRRAALVVARVAKLGQRAAAALEIGGGDVIEDQLAIAQVTAREPVLDPLLARTQPVERGLEVILIGALHAEL